MDRGLSRSLPYLPRYHSVSPARAPRRFSSTRSLSQPSQKIIHIDGEKSTMTIHNVRPPSSRRQLSPFHTLTAPPPKPKPIKVILLNARLTSPLYRISHTGSWNDLNSSHVYRSLDSLHNGQNRIYNKPEVVAAASSCDDIYHKGPFFPDASRSESGISVGESEEGGRGEGEQEDDDTDAASQYSYASSSAFFDATLDSEYDRTGESDNDAFSNDGKLSPAVLSSRGHNRTLIMSPLSSYAEARKRELMSSPSWETLEKMSSSRQQLFLQGHGHNMTTLNLKVAIPDPEHGKSRNGNTMVSTPLAQSTPHVSPKSFYGPPMLAVKGSWNTESPRSDSAISSRAMSSLSEIDSAPNSRCSSFSEDYDSISECASPKSSTKYKTGGNLTKKSSEQSSTRSNQSLRKEGGGNRDAKYDKDESLSKDVDGLESSATDAHPNVYIPPLESVIDLDESASAVKSDDNDVDETTPRAGQWWAVYNIESAKARQEAEENQNISSGDGEAGSCLDFNNRGEVKVVKPVKSGIPLISAGKYGTEKLKKTTSPPPENERNGEIESRRRSLSDSPVDDGVESSRISPPLLSLSPILQGRIISKKENVINTQVGHRDENQGTESCELVHANSDIGNGAGNLPCSPRLTPNAQQGVSTTTLPSESEVTTGDSDRLTAHASTMNGDSGVRSHGRHVDHRSNEASTLNIMSSLTTGANGDGKHFDVGVDSVEGTFASENTTRRRVPLDNNSDKKTVDENISLRGDQGRGTDVFDKENRTDKHGVIGEGVEEITPKSVLLSHSVDPGVRGSRPNGGGENKQLEGRGGVVGTGIECNEYGGAAAGSNYVLPAQDNNTASCKNSINNTGNTIHSSFRSSQYQSDNEGRNERGDAGLEESILDSGICLDSVAPTSLNLDKRCSSGVVIDDDYIDSPRVVKLCEDFQALSLSDHGSDSTGKGKTIGDIRQTQGRAPVGVGKGLPGNENVNINIDTSAAAVSIRENSAVQRLDNKDKANNNPVDTSDSIQSSNVVCGTDRDVRECDANSMKRCVGCKNNKSCLSSCLVCNGGRQEEGDGVCYPRSVIPHGSNESIDLSDGRDGEKREGGIINEQGIIPVTIATVSAQQIPAVIGEDNNNDNNKGDNNGASVDDDVVFDVRDNKIVLTLSSTPGNIISITHTAIPIHIDDSHYGTPPGQAPFHSHYRQHSQLPYSSDNARDELAGYERIMTGPGASNSRQQQLLAHHHSSNHNDYTGGDDDGSGEAYIRNIPKDSESSDRRSTESDSNVLWQQERFSQDYCDHYYYDDYGDVKLRGVVNENGEDESIHLSSSYSGNGSGGSGSGCRSSIGDGRSLRSGDRCIVNKGIPQQVSQSKVEGVREMIISDAQKIDDDGDGSRGSDVNAPKSTTQWRRAGSDNDNCSVGGGDREFLLQSQPEQGRHRLVSDRQPAVTAVDGDNGVNNNSSSSASNRKTTRIVKKIHRKTVEETVTIERTTLTTTPATTSASYNCEHNNSDNRSGVCIDCGAGDISSGIDGQLLTNEGEEEAGGDKEDYFTTSSDGRILDCVKSSTNRKETVIEEENVDFVSTCELSSEVVTANDSDLCANRNISGHDEPVSRDCYYTNRCGGLCASNGAERSSLTDPTLCDGPLNVPNYSLPTNSSIENEHQRPLNSCVVHSEYVDTNNNNNNNNIVEDTANNDTTTAMRGDKTNQMRGHYDANASSPGVYSLPSHNQGVLDDLQSQLSSINNGGGGGVNNTMTQKPGIRHLTLEQRLMNTQAFFDSADTSDRTHLDGGRIGITNLQQHTNRDVHSDYTDSKGVSRITGHDTTHQQHTINNVTLPSPNVNNLDVVSQHSIHGGQMSATHKQSQNTPEAYDNNNNDYDYVLSSSDPNLTQNQNSSRNNHHQLVLLKPGQAKSSSLWTLQEETESLLDGLSPRQTTSPTRSFHSFTLNPDNSMDASRVAVIHSNPNNQQQNTHFPPPPAQFMDDNNRNITHNSSRVLYPVTHGQRMRDVSDYSELDEHAMAVNNYSSQSNSVDQRSSDIDQEVAQSLSDIETTLRALNGDGQFDYSLAQTAPHVPSSSCAPGANNSFYNFVNGLGAQSDFTFDFVNSSHASPLESSPGNQISAITGHHHQDQLSLTTHSLWKQQNATYSCNDSFDNRSPPSSCNNEDLMNSSIASSSNLSSNQDVQSEASSRLQILDLDLSRISSCASPAPSDYSDGSAYTCRGTAEIRKNVSVSFDDDYDMLPAISTPRFVPSSTPRKQTTKLKSALKKPATPFGNAITNNHPAKHEEDLHVKAMRANWVKQFDQIIEDFNNKTSRLGPDPELKILEVGTLHGDPAKGVETKTTGDDLYKKFVNEDSEKKQNHVCIVDEPEGMDTLRFKKFLKKSHTRRNSKGKRLVRFLSRLSCVSESVQHPPSPEHVINVACTKKARLANGNSYTTEFTSLPAEREPVVLTASSASRLAHHYHRANSPTHFTTTPSSSREDHSPTSSIHSLDSLRSRTDSAYSSVSESIVLHSPQSPKSNITILHPEMSITSNTTLVPNSNTSTKLPSPSSSRLVSHPDSAFSSMSESVTLSTSSVSEDTGHYSSDMLSALSDVFDQLEVCEDEIDQALLNRLRYSHRSAAHRNT